ncbi:MAG: VanZ family protein [Chthoniobacterales bacterium]
MKTNPPFLPLPGIRPLLWIAFILWMGTVWALSSLTPKEMPPVPMWEGADKVAHFILFMAGACVLCMALRASVSWRWLVVILVSIVVVSLYGATDEYHQLYTVGRSGADVGDWIADSAGAVAGSVLIIFVYGLCERKKAR